MAFPFSPPISTDALLSEKQVAALLGVTTRFLQARRLRRLPPRFCKIGRLVKYRHSDIVAFVSSGLREPVQLNREEGVTQ